MVIVATARLLTAQGAFVLALLVVAGLFAIVGVALFSRSGTPLRRLVRLIKALRISPRPEMKAQPLRHRGRVAK